MKISILNIGSELLDGRVQNTNARDIGAFLNGFGYSVDQALTVGDSRPHIEQALRVLVPACSLLIITGGLGPTEDDITRFATAGFLGVGGRHSSLAQGWLRSYLRNHGYQSSETQNIQTWLPSGCRPLQNRQGTACGFKFRKSGTQVIVLPGVPSELARMLPEHVAPFLIKKRKILSRQVWLWGLSESRLQLILNTLAKPKGLHLSILASHSGTCIKAVLPVSQPNAGELSRHRAALFGFWKRLSASLPQECIVDAAGHNLPEAVIARLKKASACVATAESCTGGLLGFLITSVPGSSRVFHQGYITYADSAKRAVLSVSAKVLKSHGAVSEQAVREMVHGALGVSGASYACAVSGIAGPGGGSRHKPVGTVWIAAGSSRAVSAVKLSLKGDRASIRMRSAHAALFLLLSILKESEFLHLPSKKKKKDERPGEIQEGFPTLCKGIASDNKVRQ